MFWVGDANRVFMKHVLLNVMEKVTDKAHFENFECTCERFSSEEDH